MQLGEMLVREGVLSPESLEEAIAWQVIYGGRLGTNLLELGLCDEKTLAHMLGRQNACEWTWGEIELSESIVRTVPENVARRHEIVPWRIEGRRFKVLAASPGENIALFDEIGFKLGLLVKPVVAPEFRIHQLLRRHFGSVRQMRSIDFGVRPKTRRPQSPVQTSAEELTPESQGDLMDDEAFAAIYANAIAGRARPGVSEPEPEFVDASIFLTPIEDDDLPLVDAELVSESEHELPPPIEHLAAAFAAKEAELEAQAQRSATPPEDLSPLSFAKALQEIDQADSRDQVARSVLRYARSIASRAILLNVQGDVLTGWDALGDGLVPEDARRIAVPLKSDSVFRLVRESRSHYIGPIGKDSGNVRFLKLAGKQWPASASIMPILFRERVVYILYTDNGHKRPVNPEVGELLVLAQKISHNMEKMAQAKGAKARR